MLDFITTSFFIKSPSFDKSDFEHNSSELFDEWDSYVESYLNLPDYALTLVLEEGSIKGKGKIAAGLAALYFGIGSYSDFVSGLSTIHEQASYITNALFDQAKNHFSCSSDRGNTRKAGGEIVYLQRLFERVQLGSVTPEQAMHEITLRWGEEATSSPGFMRSLASSLEMAPRFPQQLLLADESWPDCIDLEPLRREPEPRTPYTPKFPIPQHYRIEISRQSKGEKKKIKLTKVR